MGNYIVINSKFQPFSYERYLAPMQAITNAYNEIEDQYAELSTRASVWEKLANEQTESYAYKMYKEYSNELEKQAGQLAREGLTPASRQNMLGMKQRYSSDIIPLEQAYTRRQALVDEQRKGKAQDSTLLFDRDASTLTLEELVKNPHLTYQPYSGAEIRKQVSAATQNLAKEIRENPRKWDRILGGRYFETLMQQGFSSEEILQTLIQDENASPILDKIMEDAITSSGIMDWGNENALVQAYNYAKMGLWDAVGQNQYQTLVNQGWGLNQGPAPSQDTEDLFYRMVPKTSVDGDKKTTQLQEDYNTILEILQDPTILDKQDIRTVSQISPNMTPLGPMAPRTNTASPHYENYYPYQEKLSEISKRYNYNISYTLGEGTFESNLGELAKQLENDIKSSAIRSFTYKPNITQSDLIIQVLKENIDTFNRVSETTGLYEIKDNEVKDAIDSNKLDRYLTSKSHIGYDPDLGLIITGTDDKNKINSALIDFELIDDPNRTLFMTHLDIQKALKEGDELMATRLIDDLMTVIYYKFNTLAKRQSNTFSKER